MLFPSRNKLLHYQISVFSFFEEGIHESNAYTTILYRTLLTVSYWCFAFMLTKNCYEYIHALQNYRCIIKYMYVTNTFYEINTVHKQICLKIITFQMINAFLIIHFDNNNKYNKHFTISKRFGQ